MTMSLPFLASGGLTALELTDLSNTLYIIGNGFDLHHRIPSSYQAFGAFLKTRDSETYNFVERYFDVNASFWSQFEERLAHFDTDGLIDDASLFLVGYGAEDWSDSYHHDYQYELNRAAEAISETMRQRFGAWIRQLPIPRSSDVASLILPLDTSATFLNFNYTTSLKGIYRVNEERILHIHGSASDVDSQLVLGHGWKPPESADPYRFEPDPEGADMRVVEGQRIIDDYFKQTFKPTERIIAANGSFFANLADVNNVLVMGHSLSEVDHPYFHEVIQNIRSAQTRWRISYYGDVNSARNRVDELGIDQAMVEYLLLSDRDRWG